MLRVVFSTVFIESLVEISKGIGDSFSRSDAFTFFVLYFCDEDSLLCCFDSRDISYTFEVFKDSLDVLFSLHSFSLMHFLCIYPDLSVVVSLHWVCFSSPR